MDVEILATGLLLRAPFSMIRDRGESMRLRVTTGVIITTTAASFGFERDCLNTIWRFHVSGTSSGGGREHFLRDWEVEWHHIFIIIIIIISDLQVVVGGTVRCKRHWRLLRRGLRVWWKVIDVVVVVRALVLLDSGR